MYLEKWFLKHISTYQNWMKTCARRESGIEGFEKTPLTQTFLNRGWHTLFPRLHPSLNLPETLQNVEMMNWMLSFLLSVSHKPLFKPVTPVWNNYKSHVHKDAHTKGWLLVMQLVECQSVTLTGIPHADNDK